MLTGKIPYDGEYFQEVLENNKRAIIDFNIKELKNVPMIAFNLLHMMLELEPENRPTAKECLEHDYFSNNTFASMVINDELDEGVDLSYNLQVFKEKYGDGKNKNNALFDSIKFNANPTMKGNTDTYGSVGGNSQNSKNGGRIDSIDSIKKKGNKQGGKADNAGQRSSIYRYALMNGGKGVDLQQELKKMTASPDSYISENSDHSGEKGKNSQAGNKSKFANN